MAEVPTGETLSLRPEPDSGATVAHGSAPPRAERAALPGRTVGDYELIEEIARGGMGVVFRARQIGLNREVAVKMILSGPLASPAAVARFRQEGMAYLSAGIERVVTAYQEKRGARLIGQYLAAGEPIPPDLRELHLIRSFKRASRRYAPAPWPGRALLFKAERVDFYHRTGGPAYGWDQTITTSLEVVLIPGDHRSIMTGANAMRIARRLAQEIEQGLERPATGANTETAAPPDRRG